MIKDELDNNSQKQSDLKSDFRPVPRKESLKSIKLQMSDRIQNTKSVTHFKNAENVMSIVKMGYESFRLNQGKS